MGKGGQKVAAVAVESTATEQKVVVVPMKLDHLETAELKKWAKAYGVDAEVERDALLVSLVRKISTVLQAGSQMTELRQLHHISLSFLQYTEPIGWRNSGHWQTTQLTFGAPNFHIEDNQRRHSFTLLQEKSLHLPYSSCIRSCHSCVTRLRSNMDLKP